MAEFSDVATRDIFSSYGHNYTCPNFFYIFVKLYGGAANIKIRNFSANGMCVQSFESFRVRLAPQKCESGSTNQRATLTRHHGHAVLRNFTIRTTFHRQSVLCVRTAFEVNPINPLGGVC